MEDPRIISALFIFLKMAYYNVLINTDHRDMAFSLAAFRAVRLPCFILWFYYNPF